MLFRKHTNKKAVLTLVFLSVLIPLCAVGAPSEQDLDAVKGQFDQLWHTAAETGKRRAMLERDLATFDVRVASAKRDLENATNARLDVNRQIDDRKALIKILNEQLRAAAETRGLYQAVAVTQKDDIVSFIRYLDGRQIALKESGPVIGGSLLRHVLRGSLGDSVSDALADAAFLKARRHFASQVGVLISETDKAETRIRQVLSNLTDEINGLESRGDQLAGIADLQAAVIDESWRQKQLNEEELKHVVEETNDVNAEIAAMQASLLRINDELRQQKLDQLESEIRSLENDRNDLMEQVTVLERKNQAMALLQKSAEAAQTEADRLRGSDRKLYKRIEEVQLRLKQLQSDSMNGAAAGSGASSSATLASQTAMSALQEQIALMQTGVPEDAAEAVVRTRRQAFEAAGTRAQYSQQIADFTAKIGTITQSIEAKKQDIETTKTTDALTGLPPMFSWPVFGMITAGYFDPDYQKVFSVPHRAIDIAVPQATPIRSVSQGIVFAVKDGGATGYSYILIGHAGGYASLYGHVSASFVKPGDKIAYGQIIGLTGGEPGSHGAGHMTTGAHLHLEMMRNGEHLNPLSVLPSR